MLAAPLRGFNTSNTLFAGVWLVFLAPAIIAVTADHAHAPGFLSAEAGVVLIFCVAYLFSIGSASYFPRGWSSRSRVAARWALLVLVALASIPVFGVWAVIFVPYLGALLAYLAPVRAALPAILATGTVVLAVVWRTSPADAPGTAIIAFGLPLLVLVLGVLTRRKEATTELERDLDLARQREDIATDVHDLLGHTLTVINLKSEVARRAVDNDPEQAKHELAEIAQLSRQSLAEVRATVTRMRTPTLAGELEAARRALSTSGIAAHLPECAPTNHDALFSWALRELTTNVIRHSGARNCWVTLTPDTLTVADDGAGFTSTTADHAGGLAGLQSRLTEGALLITRELGRTTVTLSMGRP
ncbi:sensor histidine kinase [Corynebacterium gottingense]